MRVFLSAASAEFETYREALRRDLSARGRRIDIQEDFAASGEPTLEKLSEQIRACDVVVHLIGDLPGALAAPRSVEALRDQCPDLARRFPVLAAHLAPGGPPLSYTQWEAWLALYHRRRVIVAMPQAGAPRGPRHRPPTADDTATQSQHRERLAEVECHVEFHFASLERLAIELHRALAAVPAGAAKPCDLPLAASRFVGRAEALVDLVRRLRAGQHATVVGTAGFGKTALAAAALRAVVGDEAQHLATSPWPDGIVGLDLYVHQGRAEAAWHALADRVGGADFLRDRGSSDRAAEALRDRRLLIVVEGAEQADGVAGRISLPELQRPLGATCRWLVLTRLQTQADPTQRVWLQDQLSDAEAAALLDEFTGQALKPDLRSAVLALLQGHPLALTWAGKLLARGDEDPGWLVREWQATALPSLADPVEGRKTLEWLFGRSASRLDPAAVEVMSVMACLAPTPVPRAALQAALPFARGLEPGLEPQALRASLRQLVQQGLLRAVTGLANGPHWQFGHALAYGYARQQHPAAAAHRDALSAWLGPHLQQSLTPTQGEADIQAVSSGIEHAQALLQGAPSEAVWSALRRPLLYDIRDRLVALGWSVQVESCLAAVAAALETWPADAAHREGIEPEDIDRERAVLGNRRADLLLQRGDLGGAEQAYRASLAVAERLAKADPSNAQWQRDLSVSQIYIGQVLSAQGDLGGAEQAYRASLAVRERLAKADPSNAQWQRDLSVSQNKIGEVLSAQGDLGGAEQAYRASLAVRERLAKADPSNAQWQRDLSFVLTALAELSEHAGRRSDALEFARRGLVIDQQLAGLDPLNVVWQKDMAVSRALVARLGG
jgi:tetratricopeptide (TPR) repeat protein